MPILALAIAAVSMGSVSNPAAQGTKEGADQLTIVNAPQKSDQPANDLAISDRPLQHGTASSSKQAE